MLPNLSSEIPKEEMDYFICNDEAALLNMVQLGHTEIHPGHSTRAYLDYPDWIVFDLKPDGVEFPEVVRTALQLKKTLDALEVKSYCKTSGGNSLHIYVPLSGRYGYASVAKFAEYAAQQAHKALPHTTTTMKAPSQRRKKVFIDFTSNAPGKTLVAPYSVVDKAAVSTPLEWKEVTPKLVPSAFNIKTVLKRVDRKGDLWKPVLSQGVNLHNVLYQLVVNK
jgi:bifunctional non-homologous end joining protein LigD